MSTSSGDSLGLKEFGYRQHLNRGGIHKFSMFALSYAFISLLVGATTLTGFGIAAAGPAFWWMWVGVTLGQLLVAFVFAELAAEYPIAGSLYIWARRVTSPLISWLAGYLAILAWTVAVAAVALTWQLVMPQISSTFQFIGDGTGPSDYGRNAFLLGSVVMIVSTIFNVLDVRVAAFVNTVAVVVELIAVIALIALLFAHTQRGPGIVFDTAGTAAAHSGGYITALLIAVAAPGFVLFGFDSAGTLAEESGNPRHESPRAIVRSLLAAGFAGILLMLAVLVSVDAIDLEAIGSGGLPFVIKQQLGDTLGNVFLIAVAAAVFAAAVAIQHGAARLIFAMARDNNLPFGKQLSKLNPRKSPAEAAVLVGVVSILLMAFNLFQSQIVAALATVSTILAYLSYLCVTGPLLRRRFEGKWPLANSEGRQHFTLGRWGKLINIAAVIWGSFIAFDLAWPWSDIYNPVEPFHWYVKYAAWLFISAFVGLGVLWFQTYQRHRTGTVEHHRVAPSPVADTLGSSVS
jgi:urea carboxylase system permease